VHPRTPVPVLPDVAARIRRTARRDENGCLISALTPSQRRPSIRVGGGDVKASRVVMAAHIGRPIEAHEDVHHSECRNGRCVEPTHLVVIPTADHRAHHGAERRLEICPRHNIPYGRRSADGRPACLPCQTQASARWRRRHPDYRRPALTEEQRLRRNEQALRRYHEKRRAAA
jgi:hypothetical protein